MSSRGVAPAVGVVLLILVVVALAGVTVALVPNVSDGEVTTFDVSLSVYDARGWVLDMRHEGGDAVDLESVGFQVSVDGTPLEHQPKVPYFAHRGFGRPGTGPFNLWSDNRWSAGERGTITVASTNSPPISEGSRVVVRIVHDGQILAEVSATASA